MSSNTHKVIIIGGGPIGLTCALLLAARRIGSCVLDARTVEQARRDTRLLALSRGTWELLTPILGAQVPPRAPIRDVFVSSAGDFGSTHIAASDFDGADLGATVYYGDLLAELAQRAAAEPAIEILRPAEATETRQRPDRVDVVLADGRTRSAEIAVHAEGLTGSPTSGPTSASEDWALLADLHLLPARGDLPAGAAFERFTRDGPLALLPAPRPYGGGAGRGFSMVWCMDAQSAQRRSQLDDEAVRSQLQSSIGARIGTVLAIGPRRAVPLPQRMREQVHQHRVIALGNAAQTLHPVAGQGFNLGVRDCASLANALAGAGSMNAALADYASLRRADRAAIATLTGTMPALFRTRFGPLALARGIGLSLLDIATPLRRSFAQLLMFGVRT